VHLRRSRCARTSGAVEERAPHLTMRDMRGGRKRATDHYKYSLGDEKTKAEKRKGGGLSPLILFKSVKKDKVRANGSHDGARSEENDEKNGGFLFLWWFRKRKGKCPGRA